jgi:hypothetical protein
MDGKKHQTSYSSIAMGMKGCGTHSIMTLPISITVFTTINGTIFVLKRLLFASNIGIIIRHIVLRSM